jgi:hypothetical protein
MNRREFVLASTASLGAVPLLRSAQDGTTVAGAAHVPPNACAILYDCRFTASRTFGAEMARRGGAVRAIDGDVTVLWRDELAPLWARGEGVIAGLTTARTLLCLEQLAWDHRLRVTTRVLHTPDADRRTRHAVVANALVTWVISA